MVVWVGPLEMPSGLVRIFFPFFLWDGVGLVAQYLVEPTDIWVHHYHR
jgi:hypothetical protein